MKISIQSWVSGCTLPLRERLRLFKNAGFDTYDASVYEEIKEGGAFFGADYLAKAHAFRAYADELGIACNQAHAPFGARSIYNNPDNAEALEDFRLSMEISAVLGASAIVIHPTKPKPIRFVEDPELSFAENIRFYRKLIPYAKQYGIKIAIENMWEYSNGAHVPGDSMCSRAKDFCRLLDELDSEHVVGCLDIGHVQLVAADIPTFIRTMGNKRLRALHVHDVDGVHDIHTLPYLSKVDYGAVCRALGEIGYEGDLTFEACGFFARFPEKLLPAAMRFMYETGVHLVREIDRARQ